MKTKNRILGIVLVVTMFLSTLSIMPPLEVLAAAPDLDINIPSVGYIGEDFVITGEATYDKSRIDIVHIAIYENSDKKVGVWCFRQEGLHARSFDFEDDAGEIFTWGDKVKSVNPDSTNPSFDTGAYESVFVEVIVKAEDGKSITKTATVQVKEKPDAEFYGDINFPNVIQEGEEFVFDGIIEVENSPIDIVNIGIYADSAMKEGITYYRSENVNSYEFDFSEHVDSFVWGDILETVKEDSTNPPFDTAEHDQAYFVVTVRAKDGNYETYTHLVKVEGNDETVISGAIVIPESVQWGAQYAFSGVVTSVGSPIDIVNIGIYSDSTMNAGITYERRTGLHTHSFDFAELIDSFTWGAVLTTVTSSSNPPLDTGKLTGCYVVITVKAEDGTYRVYEGTTVVVTKTVGDIDGDGAITSMDRFLLSRCVAGMEGYTGLSLSVADIDRDGYITETDVEYLSRHLAGWVGYEVLPEANADTGICSHAKYTDYWYDTIFLDNTYNAGNTHTYYHVFNRKCDNCGISIGRVQSEQKTASHDYDKYGLCSCGLICTSGYAAWSGYNSTQKTATVYETAYSSQWYGSIFAGEQVTVLGEIDGRYYIRYIVTKTQQYKYGYVSTDAISQENESGQYTIEYGFETVTLPISNRTVLLIPIDGSAYFTIKKDGEKITDLSDLPGLKFEFSQNNVDTTKITGWTLVGGKTGGYGSIKVSFIGPDGEEIRIDSTANYIVAESDSVYGSRNKALFNESEREYIIKALDLAFSGGNIRRPRTADFTYWDNVLLNLDKLWDNISNIMQGKNYTTEQFADVLASYLEAYLDGKTGDYEKNFAEWIYSFFAVVWEGGTEIPWDELPRAAQESLKIIQAYKGKKFSYEAFVSILTETKNIVSDNAAKMAIESLMPNSLEGVYSPKDIVKNIDDMISNKQYLQALSDIADAVEIGKSVYTAGVLLFGDYRAQLELLETIRSVLIDGGFKDNSPEIKAVDLLIDRYNQTFFERLHEGYHKVEADILKLGLKKVLTSALPGAVIMLEVAGWFAGKTGVSEEARYTMFRMISHGYITSMSFPYDMVVSGKMTQNVDKIDSVVKIYITMALYENNLAINAYGEFSKEEREQYKWNIDFMEEVFKDYLK